LGTFSPRRINEQYRSDRPVASTSRLSDTGWISGKISA
jgi:hypothetical protein